MFRIGKEETAAVDRVIQNGILFRINTDLKEVLHFEEELTEKFGVGYALCVSSGTAALTCSLVGMGIGPGDEVIVPAYTFISTAIAVLNVGAIPVLADVDETLTIAPEDIKRKITKRTKAIIPVHICGFPSNMDAIMQIADEYGLLVLEDACQADGGSYHGRRLGSIGCAGTLSFNFFKIIGAGEGGAVLTDDLSIYERALVHHDVGCPFWSYERTLSEEHFAGSQFRVSEITGAILRVQLTRLDGILADLRRIKKRIMNELSGVPGIRFSASNDPDGDCGIQLPFIFDSEAKARKFAEYDGGLGVLPIDSDRHVYVNWTPVLNKRGAYNAGMNPFSLPANQGCFDNLNKDACPRTLDYLSRTVFIGLHPDMDDDAVTGIIERCRNAAANINAH